MRPWPSSLRSRLALWYAVLLAVPLIAFAIVCYIVFERTLLSRTDRFIGDALTAFSRELVAERRVALSAVEAMNRTVEEVRFRDLHIAIIDSSQHLVAMSELPRSGVEAPGQPPSAAANRMLASLAGRELSRATAFTLPGAFGGFRVVTRPLSDNEQRFTLTGTYALADIASVLAQIREMFLIAIPLLVVFAAIGGYFLAARGLAPVASMTARAAGIGESNLHERLPVGGGDELVALARVVNGLLDRLQHSLVQQRQFVADASHELRTPTAIVLSEADVTLSREHREEPEYRASVAVMRDAAARLTRIVDDLFLLARADSGHLTARMAPLYLEELVHDATRSVRSVADHRGVQVEVLDLVEAPFTGDADLLGRLLLNLLDNAIKYSYPGGSVQVTMVRDAERCEICVIDGGPGIPADAQARVFERFYRADTMRSRAETTVTSGAGLGLSIARRIAELHDATLELVESRPGRTEFRVRLTTTLVLATS